MFRYHRWLPFWALPRQTPLSSWAKPATFENPLASILLPASPTVKLFAPRAGTGASAVVVATA
jgi:hypothetical protein